ncbi:cytochrome c biogenesis CcdA family protein [Nonomuraea gerenzanensis]|uniref:1-deoxy-D-xylulose 5-phosphate reductoisomerase n=1 Tax=Nonomuraea gerenzanensis TaxID=93944 RepID=A0A1M4EBY8_9ACTN|nr:cytochrome c biogenesis CcdA family protein [Nonomuraea gerenzanensis]UBU18301.1 cytochrome c biogenesis CcdA family protein [Nonomuraea gerenzanensis]SBO96123.1 1-deoxy-D-xylulose 5-phosphate reductoisomerase [Nonomuraea gerenzanensis]
MIGELPLALALSAGLVAAFNPCGFALLPAYLTMLVTDGQAAGGGPVRRALLLAVAMTAGFVTVFGVFGLVVTPLAISAGRYLPWATILIGLALTGLGVWLLTGRELLIRAPRLGTGRPAASFASLYGYGLSYAVASLSCTVGPFLAVTSAALAAGGFTGGLFVFVAYGVGMGLVVAALSLTVALARSAVVARTRAVLPYVSRVSGALLVLAGLYVAYYGWYELRVYAGASPSDAIIDVATEVQGAVARWLDSLGVVWVVVALAVLAVIAVVRARGRRRAR